MLLNHSQLCQLLDDGVIQNGQYSAINSASIDLHLGDKVLVEVSPEHQPLNYSKREKLCTREVDITEGFVLFPGQFILAQTREIFHLPLDVSGEYKLKSSMARIGLEHLNAGWADAGWHGSVLTLEFKNMSNFHQIQFKAGDPIGQMVFFRHDPVELDCSYAIRGRYNNDLTASGIKA